MNVFKTEEERLGYSLDVELHEDGLFALHPVYGTIKTKMLRKKVDGVWTKKKVTKTPEEMQEMLDRKERASKRIRKDLYDLGVNKGMLSNFTDEMLYSFVLGITYMQREV